MKPSRAAEVWSMLRAWSGMPLTVTRPFSFCGSMDVPDCFLPRLSPSSERAIRLRVFWVVPVLLVTHTSTRVTLMPVVRLGNRCIAAS